MPVPAPPILCKHPMLETLETLASNEEALMAILETIVLGGKPEGRIDAIGARGLFHPYQAGEQPLAKHALLHAWGDEATLLHISETLGQALQKIRGSATPKRLRAWWAAGATKKGIRCLVGEDDENVYFVMLTEPLDDAKVADKAAFDGDFLSALKAQAVAFEDWADLYV
jgi:hypothetical protein